jgi:lia operon protein LiaF
MGGEVKNNRNRNTALLFVGTGVYILLSHLIDILPLIALIIIALGVLQFRSGEDQRRRGYLIIAIGGVLLLANQLTWILAIVLISLGYFYMNSKKNHRNPSFQQKQTFIGSIRFGKEPWVLKDSSYWLMIGEIHMDLSMAIFEQEEITLVLQGIIGDIDIIVPEDVCIEVTANVLIGQMDLPHGKDSGVLNKALWKSPHFEASDQRVKLIVSYIVGDVDIRFV